MPAKKALIISLLPLAPVKCGMQNTIYLLYKYLKKKNIKVFFFEIKTNNTIDPIIDLKHEKKIHVKLSNTIKKVKPDLIFVNTTKCLQIYEDVFFKKKLFKTILVVHDLYFFRRKYFKQINIIDKTPLNEKKELDVIKKTNFFIDFSNDEFKYLMKNKIDNKKSIRTMTPTDKFNKINLSHKKKYDILYTSSNWTQNKINFLWFLYKMKYKKNRIKILVNGFLNDKKIDKKKVTIKKYSKYNFTLCKLGVAIIKSGTGRKVKIFEMLASGIPVVTNLDLSEFGLKINKHYFYLSKINSMNSRINLLLNDLNFRKKLSLNGHMWSKNNSYYPKAFKQINKILI